MHPIPGYLCWDGLFTRSSCGVRSRPARLNQVDHRYVDECLVLERDPHAFKDLRGLRAIFLDSYPAPQQDFFRSAFQGISLNLYGPLWQARWLKALLDRGSIYPMPVQPVRIRSSNAIGEADIKASVNQRLTLGIYSQLKRTDSGWTKHKGRVI